MRRPTTRYFDPGPVLALQGDRTDGDFARRAGVARETIVRWRHGMRLYRSTAERAAIRLDRHPLELWPDMPTFGGDWRERARCKGTEGRFHLAENVSSRDLSRGAYARRREVARLRRHAREMCEGCPVRVECLDWVLRNVSPHTDCGIWAATTGNQRKRMRTALGIRVVA